MTCGDDNMTQRIHKGTYKDAGVDIAGGEDFVKHIGKHARGTRRPGADAALGGFGALFDLRALSMRDPLLVASCDGVGTKVKLAARWNMHDGIGIDLVAMCVNDLLVQGAEPLFFLDYWACETLDHTIGERIVASIAQGCKQAGCALVGGETAEMPGVYHRGEYDLAGFAVGAVERDKLIDARRVAKGDVAIGIHSSGPHANGFSLIRTIIDTLDPRQPPPFAIPSNATDDTVLAKKEPSPPITLAQCLMQPTRIYVKALRRAIAGGKIQALAHITGGGIPGNIVRVIPDGLAFSYRPPPLPPLFAWLQDRGRISDKEMLSTFNLGIGMIAITRRRDVDTVQNMIKSEGYGCTEVGSIVEADPKTDPFTIDDQG